MVDGISGVDLTGGADGGTIRREVSESTSVAGCRGPAPSRRRTCRRRIAAPRRRCPCSCSAAVRQALRTPRRSMESRRRAIEGLREALASPSRRLRRRRSTATSARIVASTGHASSSRPCAASRTIWAVRSMTWCWPSSPGRSAASCASAASTWPRSTSAPCPGQHARSRHDHGTLGNRVVDPDCAACRSPRTIRGCRSKPSSRRPRHSRTRIRCTAAR